jgi:hypothetical protein
MSGERDDAIGDCYANAIGVDGRVVRQFVLDFLTQLTVRLHGTGPPGCSLNAAAHRCDAMMWFVPFSAASYSVLRTARKQTNARQTRAVDRSQSSHVVMDSSDSKRKQLK